jgi:hypothetical protein
MADALTCIHGTPSIFSSSWMQLSLVGIPRQANHLRYPVEARVVKMSAPVSIPAQLEPSELGTKE